MISKRSIQRMYLTRTLKLGRTDQLDRLARRAGNLWSTVAKWHWRFVDRQGYWLSKGQAQTMYCKGFDGLHSQSAQAVADSFYDSLNAWRKKRKTGNYEGLRPPYKQKRDFKVQWKASATRLRDDGVPPCTDRLAVRQRTEAGRDRGGRRPVRAFALSTTSKKTKSRRGARRVA